MLRTIDIQNVALIDNLSLDFSSKFNVLSGETGAGKSIIIDSLNFVMGSKTSKKLIKQGCSFMKVTACFDSPFNENVLNMLDELDIEYDGELILSRKMTVDGKGDMRVNRNILPATTFKKLSTYLVDIHGQHEHQKILVDKYHLEILDEFIKDKKIFQTYMVEYEKLKNINSEIKKLNGSTDNQERLLDLLQYQIKEIENANLLPNEDEKLEQQKLIMQNSEKIFDNLNNAYNELEGLTSVSNAFKKASNLINSLLKYDDSMSNMVDRLENLKFESMDIANVIKDKKDECDFNEYEFEEVDNRLDIIKNLKKKYGPTLEDVFKFLDKAKIDYDNIVNGKDKLIKKLQEKDEILKRLMDLALIINKKRQETATKFEKQASIELKDLGMKNARFTIEFDEIPTIDNLETRLTQTGFDKVRFLFSANAGQDLKPLSEIISGGEASRFMLALKNILGEYDDINLMVFDEIDTGISGEMGYMVACKLANISRKHQVISVSHLPQICAMADTNIFVEKQVVNGETSVSATQLSGNRVLEEISRLSGGEAHNDISLNHARELQLRCRNYKKTIS